MCVCERKLPNRMAGKSGKRAMYNTVSPITG